MFTTDTDDNPYRDYLCVDRYLDNYIAAQALGSAFQLGLIDHLQRQHCSTTELAHYINGSEQDLKILLGLLSGNGVIESSNGGYRLSEAFDNALPYRDLIEAKLDFANLVAPDICNFSRYLFTDTQAFIRRAKIFELFGYHRCFEESQENLDLTWRWVQFTTVYTKYEAAACIAHHDFSKYQTLMDIGGNSGEFSLRLCRHYSGLKATVVDLPVVCHLGKQHVSAEAEAEHIDFFKANALVDRLPTGFDAVSFKSMLHDWPIEACEQLLTQAHRSLNSGGEVIIFERGPVPVEQMQLGYSHLPILLFAHFFRNADIYQRILNKIGFRDIRTQQVELDLPFFIVSARKH